MENYKALSDNTLLNLLFSHDEKAWKEFIKRFRSLSCHCILKVLRKYNPYMYSEDVNEIFGEVCFNLLQHDMKKLRDYDPNRGIKLGSWIGLISRNTACNYSRWITKRSILNSSDELVEQKDETSDPFDQLSNKELYYHLNKIISNTESAPYFTFKDRWFVELYFGKGLKPLEISEIMRISEQTVHTKLLKIKNKLVAKVAQIKF